MQISMEDFKTHINGGVLKGTRLWTYPRLLSITHTFYCNKLTVRSACPGNCKACLIPVIARIQASNWRDSRNPHALFTWLLKDLSAQVMEQKSEINKSRPTAPEEDVDVLDAFLETLREQG